MSMETPIFEVVMNAYPLSNRLGNGATDDLPGIHKRLCVCACVEAQCNLFSCPRLSRVDRPSDPFARWRGGVIFLEFVGKNQRNPPRQHPCF
jgi:hypothetical protein